MMHETANSVIGLLRTRAEYAPEAAVLCAPERRDLSYGRLLELVEDAIQALRHLEVGPGDRVALVAPNGPEMAAAFLAVSAAAACAPLNPGYTRDELEYYITDLSPSALVVQAGCSSAAASVARSHAIPLIELLPEPAAPAGVFRLRSDEPCRNLRPSVSSAKDVALLLHTSGTTSHPKRVPLTRLNLLTSAENIATTLRLIDQDRCLNIMPLFHIHGLIGALLSSVWAGASVICTSGFDGNRFSSWLTELTPSWYTAVPTIHQAVLSSVATQSWRPGAHSLRFIRSCSAPLPEGVLRNLEGCFQVPVIEAYGMTEAAHQIASNPLPPFRRKPGSVGKPTGTEVAIIDAAGNFTARGGAGEVVLRGASVTPGYESGEELNRNAWSNGWLRTGDLGRLDEDGYLFLTGRIKEIINRGGEKVSPVEIDRALLAHPDVVDAASFAVAHPSLGEDVAAAVVVRCRERTTEHELREYLAPKLAPYKVPSRILIVATIPKSATGKVQRDGLAEKFAQELAGRFVSAGDAIEDAVAAIYADVLDVDAIGRHENFFAMGGDSLRAGQIIARVRSRFEVTLTIATMFMKSTVAEVAAEIRELMNKALAENGPGSATQVGKEVASSD
jgi:oxalate---CoA ligase